MCRMQYVLVLAVISLLWVGLASAASVSRGEALYKRLGCAGCHGGAGGSKLAGYPSLNTFSARSAASELNRYRSGARRDPTMNALARNLSDSEIEDLAAYIESF